LGYSLRSKGRKCITVQVMIKDPQFRNRSRPRKLDAPAYLAAEIGDIAVELIISAWDMKAKIRTITITATPCTRHQFSEVPPGN